MREVVSYAAVCLCRHGSGGGLRDDTKEWRSPDSDPGDSNTVVWILNLYMSCHYVWSDRLRNQKEQRLHIPVNLNQRRKYGSDKRRCGKRLLM